MLYTVYVLLNFLQKSNIQSLNALYLIKKLLVNTLTIHFYTDSRLRKVDQQQFLCGRINPQLIRLYYKARWARKQIDVNKLTCEHVLTARQ